MNSFAASLLARLADLLALVGPQPEPIAIPVRRDDGRSLRRHGGRT